MIKPMGRILAFVGSLHAIIENKGIVAMLIATIIPDNLIMHDIPKTKEKRNGSPIWKERVLTVFSFRLDKPRAHMIIQGTKA